MVFVLIGYTKRADVRREAGYVVHVEQSASKKLLSGGNNPAQSDEVIICRSLSLFWLH